MIVRQAAALFAASFCALRASRICTRLRAFTHWWSALAIASYEARHLTSVQRTRQQLTPIACRTGSTSGSKDGRGWWPRALLQPIVMSARHTHSAEPLVDSGLIP